jgi:hypothetical protein
MGMELVVARASCDVAALLARLASAGLPSTIVMIDGALVMPTAAPPATFRDLRLKTPAGTLALKQRPDGFAIVAFGNSDAALQSAQQLVADSLRALP